jgi:exodeoxyribonuclease III
VRIATWNIRAGGGRRIEQIAQVILAECPDILVLTEFRPVPGRVLLELLQPVSYHVVAGVPTGIQNCTCLLSRLPFEESVTTNTPHSAHRWVTVSVTDLDLTILAVHVPNQTEIWNKREFLECVDSFAIESAQKRALIIGDLNNALDEDHQGTPIPEASYLRRLFDAGWMDAWRVCNPDASEYSWFSHRNNGFRIDHCIVSPSLAGSISRSSMRHDVRVDRLSDHSLLWVDLNLQQSLAPLDAR